MARTRAILIGLIACFCGAGNVAAQDCGENAGTASQATVMCAWAEAETFRLRANQKFIEWMRVVTDIQDGTEAVKTEKAKPFVKSQLEWEAFVHSVCSAEASLWQGGTLQGAREADCRTRLTQERIRYIEDMIAWPLP